jgi:hypothetical protein
MTKTLRMIVKGGLGNQLFQYFAGRELSDETERKLVLDLSWYRRNVHKNGLLNQRNFMLNQYKFAETCTTSDEFVWRNAPLVERVIKRLPNQIGNSLGFFHEPTIDDLNRVVLQQVVTFGHWVQNPILPIKSTLRQLLLDGIANPSHSYLDLIEEQSQINVISLHHRLGDYKNFSSIYEIKDEKYFLAGSRLISNRIKGAAPEIWLFSDEPDISYSLLSKSIPISRVVNSQAQLNEAETISLMARSKGIIASNSTFSWWASYLSDESNTSIVFPKNYMKNILTQNSGLYVDGWDYL